MEERLTATLAKYVSPMMAAGMVRRAIEKARVTGLMRPRDIEPVLAALSTGIRLFVDAGQQEAVLADLRKLPLAASSLPPRTMSISTELEAANARLAARDLAERMGGGSLACHKVATAVSELARNLVQYAGGGRLDLIPAEGPKRILVRAVDSGPGIRNLDEILAGRYKSRTGLGLGLLGVKRLAASFRVHTNPTLKGGGTIVEAEFPL